MFHSCYEEVENNVKLVSLKRKVYFFGVAPLGEYILNIIKNKNEDLNIGFIDNNYCEKEYNGILVKSPQIVKDEECTVLIASSHIADMTNQLEKMGKKINVDYYVLLDLSKWHNNVESQYNDKHINDIKMSHRDKQMAMLEILKYIKKICVENNIRYFLSSGTLIGAVRHKGFIPWDDDIDINVPYDDIRKLLGILSKNDEFVIMSPWSDTEWRYPWVRIGRKDLSCLTTISGYVYLEDTTGIDIFLLAGLGNTEKEKEDYIKDFNRFLEAFVKSCKECMNDQLFNEWILLNERYSYDESLFIAPTHGGTPSWYVMKKSEFEPCVELVFEGEKFNAPANFDKRLRIVYGDYMQLPPLEYQKSHRGLYYRRVIDEHNKVMC